jgi:hypothetical protein
MRIMLKNEATYFDNHFCEIVPVLQGMLLELLPVLLGNNSLLP